MKRRAAVATPAVALLLLLQVAHVAGLTHVPRPSPAPTPVRAELKAGICRTYHMRGNWWHYEWCHERHVRQFTLDKITSQETSSIRIGAYFGGVDGDAAVARPYFAQVFLHGDMCRAAQVARNRSAEVRFSCCTFRPNETYIESVTEPRLCEYLVSICTPSACVKSMPHALAGDDEKAKKTQDLQATVRAMFYHAYDNYMRHAFPLDNLRPISCKGDTFELGKIPMLTLIDTLDTLVVFGDHAEFRRAVGLVLASANFNLNTEVSVFETTIRVLGGLLSAHIFATDPALRIYEPDAYTGGLLALAVDLADRLLPAFVTKTGIPYGTVNLRNGVPRGETTVASTAGAGSLTMEFTMLSVLTGNPVYALAARKAVRALFTRRSSLGLLGKHIDVDTGDWTETISGPGSNSDSFYEYLLKMHALFDDAESLAMFEHVYSPVMAHNKHGDWYCDVNMWDGCTGGAIPIFDNLVAFWPGMQTLLGEVESAAASANAYYQVWHKYGFLPEQFDVGRWRPKKATGNRYPLRPELIESTFHLHVATQDDSWLTAGAHFVQSLERFSKTDCGYASIADVESRAQEDDMPSFFLSETCKYLYLLFDTDNFVRRGNYVFTTEAHPFPAVSAAAVRAVLGAAADTDRPLVPTTKRRPPSCPRVPFHALVSFNATYEDVFEPVKARCEPERRKKPSSKKATPKPKAPQVLHGGPAHGDFYIDQLVGGFRARSVRFPGDALKVTNLGDPKIVVEFQSTDPARVAEFRIHSFESDSTQRCRLLVWEDGAVTDTVTCTGALFGPTKGDAANISLPHRPLVVAEPSRGCAPMAEVAPGAIVLVDRGDCFFDDKALRAQDAGAGAAVILNNDDELMIMAKSSSDIPADAVDIPVVMVAKSAQAVLIRSGVALSLELQPVPDTDEDFPYVVGSRYDLKVVGPHGWGLHLALKTSAATGLSSWSIGLLDTSAPAADDVDNSTADEAAPTSEGFSKVLRQLRELGFSDEALHLLENEDDPDLRLEALVEGLRDVGLDDMATQVAFKATNTKETAQPTAPESGDEAAAATADATCDAAERPLLAASDAAASDQADGIDDEVEIQALET
ncbi:ER degradation-enhancing alpha-mannosidase-like protein [Achlya hypogyna]|uniref:alpha-1,2-Mannosidase n=1 Tax=Achlya hypogyna TaxID=1202772 RepID=A0A0A7CPG3_ACHHY|nr:secreted protein [Achlya hypogyna]OQR97129.1 ER degradation-enhancing alpha-mannosidase-like protein [Achlya hypogyna]